MILKLARISLLSGFKRKFDYIVPENLLYKVEVGSLVLVELRNQETYGFVDVLSEFKENYLEKVRYKKIKAVFDLSEFLDKGTIAEASWLAWYYHSSFSEVVKNFFPKSFLIKDISEAEIFTNKIDDLYREKLGKLWPKIENLERITLTNLRKLLNIEDADNIIAELESKGIIKLERKISLQNRREKTGETLYFPIVNAEVEKKISKKCLAFDMWQFIQAKGMVSKSQLKEEFPSFERNLKVLLKTELIQIGLEKVDQRDEPLKKAILAEKLIPPVKLNPAQETAVAEIQKTIETSVFRTHLLFGITGSGKTEVYLKLIEFCLELNKQAMLLVPEISLTPQLINIFRERFSQNFALIHSKISQTERSRQWKLIQSGEKKIILGVRSAIFSPVLKLGLVIIDEEHETSYKQDSKLMYNARDLAIYRAREKNACVVLGSATPSVETYYNASKGKYKLSVLPDRISKHGLPEILMVDLKKSEIKGAISKQLQEELSKNLEKKKKSLLFHNRKGFSTLAICTRCGKTAHCPNCSVSLKFHKDKNLLKCHYCDFTTNPEHKCMVCGTSSVIHVGFGTEKLEQEVKAAFPHANVLRIDSEVLTKEGDYNLVYEKIRSKETDIIIGTQIIAKGLDIADITLVGVVLADFMLNIPDFRATEKSFQMLTQVAGRAGRKEDKGLVLIQTYNPGNPVLMQALSQNYEAFYEYEIGMREALTYPPFGRLINFRFSASDEKRYKSVLLRFSHIVREYESSDEFAGKLQVLGPSESPVYQLKGRFRWQMLVKSGNFEKLRKFVHIISHIFEADFGRSGVKLNIDVDPQNFF